MRVLIIGAGGREHALAQAYAKSKRVTDVLVAPGNDFMEETSSKIRVFPATSLLDFTSMLALAKKEKVNLVDVAQDNVLAEGFVDKFIANGIPAFGPTQKASEIEWSKEWSRNFMKKYHLPTPIFKVFSNEKTAKAYIQNTREQSFFIKASGLALGKGAIRTSNRREAIEAIKSMQQFGEAGKTFLIEQCLEGEEFSLFAICDGKSYKVITSAQDHKTAYERDLGPNTGGMGATSPLSIITKTIENQIKKTVLDPFMKGMLNEERPYTGILYLGGMLTREGVQIIEFNSRWGEPEANVILPSFKTDYLTIIESALSGTLKRLNLNLDKKVRIVVTGSSAGYPLDYAQVKGKRIYNLEKVMQLPGVSVYGSGIKRVKKQYIVNGGRIFYITAEGTTLQEARQKAYGAMSQLLIEGNNLHFRSDIGWRDLERINAKHIR